MVRVNERRHLAMQCIAVCLLFSFPLLAQGPAKIPSDLRFEVVSLKPSKEQGKDGGMRRAPGGERYEATNCPIDTMIEAAYRVIGAFPSMRAGSRADLRRPGGTTPESVPVRGF